MNPTQGNQCVVCQAFGGLNDFLLCDAQVLMFEWIQNIPHSFQIAFAAIRSAQQKMHTAIATTRDIWQPLWLP